jgi:hypothetical protein
MPQLLQIKFLVEISNFNSPPHSGQNFANMLLLNSS